MRKLLCLSFFLFISVFVFGQAKKFDKKFGFFEYELTPFTQIVDSQNNHIVVGQFKGYHQVGNTTIQTRGDLDIFMIKYDSNNAIVWVKTFGSSAEDNIVSLSCDKVGNLYFTGSYAGNAFYTSTTDSLRLIPSYSQSRYVVKLNSSGNTIWSKRFSATITSGDPTKSEVINDHEGRLYLVVTNRASGTLNSWQFQDSVIANPVSNVANLNTPRWLLTRLNENTGSIKWLDYIANPLIANNFIQILDISRPVIDKNNHLVFAVSHMGNHTTPIYVFGQSAALNSSKNNILVRIDSVGVVRNFRDLGTATNAVSEGTSIAINKNNEVVLINKYAKATDNGITYDYTVGSNTFNYARIYDENFVLIKVVKLGQQNIRSYVFDKQNRLITFGTSNSTNFNQSPSVEEVLTVDSTTKTVRFNTNGTILPYFFRYTESFKLDTFYLENRLNPLMQFQVSANSIKLANNGDIVPSIIYPVMNMAQFRYDSSLRSKNSLIGKHRDREDLILGMVEDTLGQIYTMGIIHGLVRYTNSNGNIDSLRIPFESGQDNVITKYNKDGNVEWIKKISTNANDIIRLLTISKSGLYFVVTNPSYSSWKYQDSLTIDGNQVLIKMDLNGNLLWTKPIFTNVNPTSQPNVNIVKSLKNDNLLIGVRAFNTFNIGASQMPHLGNRAGQVYAILDGQTGNVIRYNRVALRSENISQIGSSIGNAHEDNRGNLYFAINSDYTANSNLTPNELYSLKTNTVAFSHIWVNQPGILKLDSTLEIIKFNPFTSYMHLGDINGFDHNIYITGRSRNNSMVYNNQTIATNPTAQNANFISFFARLDTNLNITKISKFDTTTIESQFDLSRRKILIDTISKQVYETVQFKGQTGIETVNYSSNSIGGTDLLFVKYDSTGAVIGGQQLGTPQSDFFDAGLINKTGSLIFTSRSIDPNYSNVILSPSLTSRNIFNTESVLTEMPILRKSFSSSGVSVVKSLNSIENITINKEILSPDTYLSKYISLSELGKRPDTTVVTLSKTTFCQGDTAIIEVNDASSIRWKRDQEYLSNEGSKITINSSGVYKAIIKNIEGIIDSTRAITISVTPTPIVPAVENISYCVGVSTNILTATASNNHTLLWYGTSSTGGTSTVTASVPSASVSGQTDYYVSQKSVVNACEGPRTKITVTINPKPEKPVIENLSFCEGAIASNLTAKITNGNTLNWYGEASSTTKLASTPLISTASAGIKEFFATQTIPITGCESEKAKISITINSIPSKPVISRVEGNKLTSNTIGSIWYLDSAVLSDTNTIITPNVSGRYYVKSSQNGCVGVISEAYYFLTTNINNLSGGEFLNISPNPFNDYIKIDYLIKGIKYINVDFIQLSTGAILYTKTNVNPGVIINLPNMPSGFYLIKITSDAKIISQYKAVKL